MQGNLKPMWKKVANGIDIGVALREYQSENIPCRREWEEKDNTHCPRGGFSLENENISCRRSSVEKWGGV